MSRKSWLMRSIPVGLLAVGGASVYELSGYMDVYSIHSWMDTLTLLAQSPGYVLHGGILGISLLGAPLGVSLGSVWLLYDTLLSRPSGMGSDISFRPKKDRVEWKDRLRVVSDLMKPVKAQHITTSILSKVPRPSPKSNATSVDADKNTYRVTVPDSSAPLPPPPSRSKLFDDDGLSWDMDDYPDGPLAPSSDLPPAAPEHVSARVKDVSDVPSKKAPESYAGQDTPHEEGILEVEDDLGDTGGIAPKSDPHIDMKAAARHVYTERVSSPDKVEDKEQVGASTVSTPRSMDNNGVAAAPTVKDAPVWETPDWSGIDELYGDEEPAAPIKAEKSDAPDHAGPYTEAGHVAVQDPAPIVHPVDDGHTGEQRNMPALLDAPARPGIFSRVFSAFRKEKVTSVNVQESDEFVSQTREHIDEQLDHRAMEWFTLWSQTPGDSKGRAKPAKLVQEGVEILSLMGNKPIDRLSARFGLNGMNIAQALSAARRASNGARETKSEYNILTEEERIEDIKAFNAPVEDNARTLIRPMSSDPSGPVDIPDDLDEEDRRIRGGNDAPYEGEVNTEVQGQDPDALYKKWARTPASPDDHTLHPSEMMPSLIRTEQSEQKLREIHKRRDDEWEQRVSFDDDAGGNLGNVVDDTSLFTRSVAPDDQHGPVEDDERVLDAYKDEEGISFQAPVIPPYIVPYAITVAPDVPLILSMSVAPYSIEVSEYVKELSVWTLTPYVISCMVDEHLQDNSTTESVIQVEETRYIHDDVTISSPVDRGVYQDGRPLIMNIVPYNIHMDVAHIEPSAEEDMRISTGLRDYVEVYKTSTPHIDGYINSQFDGVMAWLQAHPVAASNTDMYTPPLIARQPILRYEDANGVRGRLQADILIGPWRGSVALDRGSLGVVVLQYVHVPAGQWRVVDNDRALQASPASSRVDRWILTNGEKFIEMRDGVYAEMVTTAMDLGRRILYVVQFMTDEGASVTWESAPRQRMGDTDNEVWWMEGPLDMGAHTQTLVQALSFSSDD